METAEAVLESLYDSIYFPTDWHLDHATNVPQGILHQTCSEKSVLKTSDITLWISIYMKSFPTLITLVKHITFINIENINCNMM